MKIQMKRVIRIIFTIALLMILMENTVSADMGNKPSIDLTITNLNTNNYLVDLLVEVENVDEYYEHDASQYNGTGLSEEDVFFLQKVNFNNWISCGTRWGHFLVFANCAGNSGHKHHFGYFGTPDIYKIYIYNKDTGEEKVSDVIKKIDYNSYVTIDYETMNVVNNISGTFRTLKTLLPALIPVITTIIVEIIILLFFRLENKKNIKIVFITNLISNLALQLLLMEIGNVDSQLIFLIVEILILVVESLVYYKTLETDNKRKTITYAIVANLISAVLTFWEGIIVNWIFEFYY